MEEGRDPHLRLVGMKMQDQDILEIILCIFLSTIMLLYRL